MDGDVEWGFFGRRRRGEEVDGEGWEEGRMESREGKGDVGR